MPSARLLCTALIAGALLLAGPAIAQADYVYVADEGDERVLHFEAAGLVGVGRYPHDPEAIHVDSRSHITAGPGCQTDPWPFRASCDRAGIDRIVVTLGPGNDSFDSSDDLPPIDVFGGDGNDRIVGWNVRKIDGGWGDDQFFPGGPPPAEVIGGPGEDTMSYGRATSPVHVVLDGLANDAGGFLHDDVENLIGSRYADTLIGSNDAEKIYGFGGADHIEGLGGDDELSGVPGLADELLECASAVLYGGAGDDRLAVYAAVQVSGGPGNDVIVPGQATEADCAAGADIRGDSGSDTLDFSIGDWTSTISIDDIPNDGLSGTSNFHSDIETVISSRLGMGIYGGPGRDILVGGPGDDVIGGGGGPDSLSGGGGDDIVDYSDHSVGVSVTLDDVANDGIPGTGANVASDFDGIWGGAGDDVLVGNDKDNVIDGGPGADVISGLGGLDAVDYSYRTAPLAVTLGGGAISGESAEHDAIASDVEGVIGGSGSDALTGSAADGFLWGGLGNDRLSDPGGTDELDGEEGNDEILSVDAAEDDVICGAGIDTALHDQIDTVLGCETHSTPAASTPPSATPPPATTPRTTPSVMPPAGPSIPPRRVTSATAVDRVAPSLTISLRNSKLQSLLAKGLSVRLTVSERGTTKLTLKVDRATAKRYRLAANGVIGTLSLTHPAGTVHLTVRLTANARRALHRARQIKATITAITRDGAGNQRTHARRVTLKT